MDSYDKEINFYLPGLFSHYELYKVFLKLYIEQPFFFKNNVKIGAIYDSPFCIWNGGRFSQRIMMQNELHSIKQMMETYQIPVRFTFTNTLLTNKDLNDSYGNILLEIFNNGKNEIICNNEILENYIRNKYNNNYKYISSTTKRLNQPEEQMQELKKNYYLIVLDYDYNKNFSFLKKISQKEKCELLCNPVCVENCPKRKEHYDIVSDSQLNYNAIPIECPYQYSLFSEAMHRKNFISNKDINKYIDLGFKHFKLEGRDTSDLNLIEILIYYLIKDEYALTVRQILQYI